MSYIPMHHPARSTSLADFSANDVDKWHCRFQQRLRHAVRHSFGVVSKVGVAVVLMQFTDFIADFFDECLCHRKCPSDNCLGSGVHVDVCEGLQIVFF